MTSFLVLDAAGATASAAVFVDGACRAAGRAAMRNRERETLLPMVLDVLREAAVRPGDLTGVVVGEGPGAFTSLRIAAATAKGLVHGTAATLSAVPSLVLLAASVGDAAPGTRRLVVTDALRGERYLQGVERGPQGWVALGPVLVRPAASMADEAARWRADPLDAVALGLDPDAAAWGRVAPGGTVPVSLATWEPRYGRLAEAQVKWETAAGQALPSPTGHVEVGGPG